MCAELDKGRNRKEAYEKNTGVLIADEFREKAKGLSSSSSGPLQESQRIYMGQKDAHEAVHNAVVAEEVTKMAARCEIINRMRSLLPQELRDKHYYRNVVANAYYGQK